MKDFSILGSCSSRNIFNSNINANYKAYFRINYSIEFVTMISLMSDLIDYDENLVNCETRYESDCLHADLDKDYLDFLKKDNTVEYLIIDTFCDVYFNIIDLGENRYISESPYLKRTKYYGTIKDNERINVRDNFDIYFDLWKKAYDDFFKFMKKNCPEKKIILNCSRLVYRYIDENGEIVEEPSYKTQSSQNQQRNILDKYLLENYDIDFLSFDETTMTDENHIFGLHPTHYETRYYTEKNYQLLEIINRNDTLGFDDELNRNIRGVMRKDQIQKMELINSNSGNWADIETANKIKNLNEKNAELKERNAELKKEINSLLNSSSWKLTAPLRNLKAKSKK